MHIKILYINIHQSFDNFKYLLPKISKQRQYMISKLNFDKGKIISLYTELLVRHEVSEQLHIPFSEIHFGYGKYGKPYLINNLEYHFSISHSNNCIVFVSNSHPIGIDIEEILDGKMQVAERFFTLNEYNFVKKQKDSKKAFYKVWTAKEAYVKMLGCGLSKSFRSFDVLDKSLNCSFKSFCLSEYIITICYKHTTNDNIIIEEISEESLLKIL